MSSLCDITPIWQQIYAAKDRTAAELLLPHARECPDCRAEVLRLNEEYEQQPSAARRWAKDFGLGLCVLAGFGLFMTARGLVRNFNQATYEMGGTPPPWFRPIGPKPKRTDGR